MICVQSQIETYLQGESGAVLQHHCSEGKESVSSAERLKQTQTSKLDKSVFYSTPAQLKSSELNTSDFFPLLN